MLNTNKTLVLFFNLSKTPIYGSETCVERNKRIASRWSDHRQKAVEVIQIGKKMLNIKKRGMPASVLEVTLGYGGMFNQYVQ